MEQSQFKNINGDFKVEISSNKITKFTSVDEKYVYLLTMEDESVYNT